MSAPEAAPEGNGEKSAEPAQLSAEAIAGLTSGVENRADRRLRRRLHLPKLSTTIKVLLLFVGWFLILLGLVGLVLPILQGVAFLVLGAAVLSLVSGSVFLLLRRAFGRWPRGWRRLLYVRRKMHHWLEKRFGDGKKLDSDSAENPDSNASP